LLVFANKQDLPGALSGEEIRDVSFSKFSQESNDEKCGFVQFKD